MGFREYTIDLNDPNEAARGQLQIFIDQLESMRATTPKPEELEWELKVYRYMLEDPAARLAAYMKARRTNPNGASMRSKRQAVKILGWEIP